jgi:hypothetical protein
MSAKSIVNPISVKSQFIPNPELKEAFEIYLAAFKIGAIFGFESRRAHKTSKSLIEFLETDQAKQMIYGALLEKQSSGGK